MNKLFSLATFAFSALLIIGCSHHVESLAPLEVPENSAQEIIFSSLQTKTRAAIESGSEWSTNNVSLSCLAKTKQVSSTRSYSIDWTKRAESGRQFFAQMCNIDASVNKGQFSWNNNYYYPNESFAYNYTFRGYYPRQPNDNITWGANSMKVDIPIDGTHDILYGLADSDESDAYSALYFQKNAHKNMEYILPALSFTHSLTRLIFKIKSGSGSTDNLKIKFIRAIDMYSRIQLTVADLVKSQNEGKVSVMGDNTESYTLKDKFGEDIVDFIVSKTSTQIGESMLVYPTESIPEKDGKGYQFEIGIENSSTTIISKAILLPETGKEFEAGVFYEIEITVGDMGNISMKPILKPWE